MLTSGDLSRLRRAIADAGVDGWLLFDFHGANPIAGGVLGLSGMQTRRIFVWIPRDGVPVAITHAIEQSPWAQWPREWKKEVYSSWRSLESTISTYVGGKRVAMEYSPGDAVPYLDRVPAGVLEMVRAAGAEVVSSGLLVTTIHAAWDDHHVASHERAAERLAAIARDAFTEAGRRARHRDTGAVAGAEPLTEYALMQWILARFQREGLVTDHGPNVSAGPNAANPHYEPTEHDARAIDVGDILLIDLWAKEPLGVYADQTWMASLGPPSGEARRVWEAVRDGRDAAIALVRDRVAAGQPVRGAEVDDVARAVITGRGFGEYFVHRTGHSIDPRDLHGSGPHIDNLESREERLLVAGIGFSIEPGVYLPGKFGMRSEVNVYIRPGSAVVTPHEYQRELIEV